MNLYLEGDVRAFDELYRRYSDKVYGFLNKKLASRAIAEKLLQVSFMKLHQYRNHYRSGETFAPWLFGIVRNSLFDHLRQSQSEKRKLENFRTELFGHEETVPENEWLNLVEEAKTLLSAEQRKLFEQRYDEELEYEEIATKNKMTPEAVRQSVSRSLRKIKNKIYHKGGVV